MPLRAVGRDARAALLARTSPRRLAELRGERVIFHGTRRLGLLDAVAGGRVLEIGPKHGEDSRLLAALRPAELVLLDLPTKRSLVQQWLPSVEELCPTRYVEANLLYAPAAEIDALGDFDLVWCTGVLYHNVEQLRLLRRLLERCRAGGRVVVESATTRTRILRSRRVVEVHWPATYRDVPTITHLPSRGAIAAWMEMVGFASVEVLPVYSRHLAGQRAVLTGIRPEQPAPYLSYDVPGHPPYPAGTAT